MQVALWNTLISVLKKGSFRTTKLKRNRKTGKRIAVKKDTEPVTPNPDPQNAFIVPPPGWIGDGGSSAILQESVSDNPVFINGSTITLQWSNNSSAFDLILLAWNNTFGSFGNSTEQLGLFVILQNCTDFEQSLEWTVATPGLPSAEMYNIWLSPMNEDVKPSPQDLFSHFFNISAEDKASSSFAVLSATSSAPVALDTKTPTSSTLNSSGVSTSTAVSTSESNNSSIKSTSTLGSTPTSSSSPKATPSSNKGEKVGIALGATLGAVLLALAFCIFFSLYKRWKAKKLEVTEILTEKKFRPVESSSGLIRLPHESDVVVLTPPSELPGDFRQPSELDGRPPSHGELYGD